MSLRRLGSSKQASDGVRLSDGKMRSASVCSRSSRNWGLVGARGASCAVANSSAGLMSPSGVEVQVRISSISCRRSNAKCREAFSSKIWACLLAVGLTCRRLCGLKRRFLGAAHTED